MQDPDIMDTTIIYSAKNTSNVLRRYIVHASVVKNSVDKTFHHSKYSVASTYTHIPELINGSGWVVSFGSNPTNLVQLQSNILIFIYDFTYRIIHIHLLLIICLC